ncbi:MAG TPA: DNA alkylation repair protein [Trueperaceae bacterium]|nr:DNA alkylation repair protein [Trueperaceae bacterium]
MESTHLDLETALAELSALGNESVRERYRKAGASENMFGVLLGDIRKVAAKRKNQHDLGLALWATGNLDARLLGILLLKPRDIAPADLDAMVRDADFAQLADWLNSYIVKNHPSRESLREAWMADANGWVARAGWSLTAGRVARSPEGLDLAALLDRLEAEMPAAAPQTQWTMNNCLASIGINVPQLRQRAIAIGEALGIYRDYPVPRGCTSPFAPLWINEMVRRQETPA